MKKKAKCLARGLQIEPPTFYQHNQAAAALRHKRSAKDQASEFTGLLLPRGEVPLPAWQPQALARSKR